MAFQRSYSKVWWASDDNDQYGRSFTSGGFYNSYSRPRAGPSTLSQAQRQFISLDDENVKSHSGNLSRIQEVDDENSSSKLWEKQESPGSLRSQDSGFSDNDESHSNPSVGSNSPNGKMDASSQNNCSSSVSVSPASSSTVRTVETPPTVIRRKSDFYSPLVHVSRRISFNGGVTNGDQLTSEPETDAATNGSDLQSQLDKISFVNYSTVEEPLVVALLESSDTSSSGIPSPCKCSVARKDKSIRRRRRVVSRKSSLLLTPKHDATSLEQSQNTDELMVGFGESEPKEYSSVPDYNNETVYFGGTVPGYNNNNENTDKSEHKISPLRNSQKFHRRGFTTASTSTPKKEEPNTNVPQHEFVCNEYDNPLLNGHFPPLQSWLDDTRLSYEHEVMSTLQTKSVAQEAFKNMTITTNTVAKIIRQLQQRAIILQSDFEKVEQTLHGNKVTSVPDALLAAQELVRDIADFAKVLERRVVFFTECRTDRKKFEENIEHIKIIVKDTRISLENRLYIQLDSLLDDIQVLKRHLLITLRLVFEKLVRVIVLSVEQSKCDLMLRANINMIATLSNIDYEGFACLTDAFVQNETVRTLLLVCLENRSSSVRALALRALATICSAREAIVQLGQAGGTEIIRDIVQVEKIKASIGGEMRRSDIERREAVSLLTQITASWHGPEHRVDGLRDSVETIVEGLTDIIAKTNCCQTLLLCAASLNNLSRIEPTAVYSIMSNETIIKLRDAVLDHGSSISIFLYEQIISMLNNMSGNKKCHSHLANRIIINFITFIFESEFYKKYRSRAESEAQRRTIKNILHAFTRLIHESSVGPEILAQNSIPIFSKVAKVTDNTTTVASEDVSAAAAAGTAAGTGTGTDTGQTTCSSTRSIGYDYGKDISVLARHLMMMQNESTLSSRKSPPLPPPSPSTSSSLSSSIFDRSTEIRSSSSSSVLKFNLTRQESYV